MIDALFPDGTLDLMVLFSSNSSVTRPAGQVDYVAANEYLNAYAKHRIGGATRVVAIDWASGRMPAWPPDAMSARRDGDAPFGAHALHATSAG